MEVQYFLNNRSKSVEEFFKENTRKLDWKCTDVLYSFLGIYVIGLYAFDKERNHNRFRRNKNSSCILLNTSKQRLYSNNYIIKQGYYNSDDNKELNELEELKEFLDVYYSIGNLIPIWPSGNESRGKFGCYDIPEFYFTSEIVKPWLLTLETEYNPYLKPVLEHKMPKVLPNF